MPPIRKELLSLVLVVGCVVGFAQTIDQLIDEAEKNLKENRWEQAFNNLTQLTQNKIDELTYQQRAIVYNHLGFINLMFLEPDEAERNLNLALLFHEEAGIPDEKDYASTLVNMSMLYLEQVEFDLSRNYIQRALDIYNKKTEYTVDYLVARSKLARIYEEAGSYTLALSIYNESYDKLLAMGNELSPDFAEICSHKGRILILTGDPVEGEKFINLSATIYESLGNQYNVQRAESMEDLALFYERMGRFDEAEALLLDILKLKRSIPDEADILIIETLNDLGIMYHQIGEMQKAEQIFNEVIVECEENVGTNHPFYATAKNNLGTIALNRGNFLEARDLLQDALKTYKEKFGTVHPYYANALNNLARVERKLGNVPTAEKYYKEVLQIDSRIFGTDHPNYATTLLNIAILYSSSGMEAEAEKYYADALRIRERALGLNHPSYASALEYMAMHYLATNNLAEAELNFRKSIEIQIDQIKALYPIMTERERELFYLKVRDEVSRYHHVASQLLDQKPELVQHIFDFQVKTKTLLFNSLDKVKELVADSEDDLLQAKYQQWLSDKRLLASYYQMGLAQLADLHVNLDLVEVNIQNQEENLTKSIEAFDEALPHDNLNWQRVLQSVKPGEAIVEMVRIYDFEPVMEGNEHLFGFTSNTRYLAIIFNHGSETVKYAFLGGDPASDQAHYDDYLKGISSDEVTTATYDLFWKPVLEATAKANTIRLVPDGVYTKINPNLIQINNDQYVIDRQFVTYLTSVHDNFRPAIQVFNNKSYFFGDPEFKGDPKSMGMEVDPDAGDEIKRMSELLAGWKVNISLNAEANELKLRSAYNPTILHLSTPGFFDSQYAFIKSKSPISSGLFNSGLYLSGAMDSYSKFQKGIPSIPENDGILTTYEALNLELDRTRLVILSAMAPEINEFEGGEGFYSFLRALTVAGARNIIASLDLLPSEKREELLTLFYKKFLETDRIEESFKHAQLEMKKKYPDPKIWGSFIIVSGGL